MQMPDNEFSRAAFSFSEKSKAVQLFLRLRNKDTLLSAGIPDDLIENEKHLTKETAVLVRKVNDEKNKPVETRNTELIHEWQNNLFELNQQYKTLIRLFEQEFPDYHQVKFQTAITSVENVQEMLQETQTAMLAYNVGKKYIHVFGITASKFAPFQILKPENFEELIEDFLFDIETKEKENYIQVAHELYLLLLEPVLNVLSLPAKSRLIIIPDGALALLPFEVLLTKSSNVYSPFSKLPYLIELFLVTYHSSATLWHYHRKKNPTWISDMEPSFIGFAPVYSNYRQNTMSTLEEDFWADGLSPEEFKADIQPGSSNTNYRKILETESPQVFRKITLNGLDYTELMQTETEVCKISALFSQHQFKSQTVLHSDATTKAFKEQISGYKYVLFAGHGDYNTDNPEETGLIFSPLPETSGNSVLYISDAFHLKLQADLVVLSCCESGIGNHNKGDGMNSMNRGFLYAGAKNVIYTLFKVLDEPSSLFTQALFRHILSQKSYIEAIAAAKTELIEQEFPPLYWSGFVLMGN